MKAYAWASGLIEEGRTVPEGALLIVSRLNKQSREIIAALARHSRYRAELIVPGIPEANAANDPLGAVDALTAFVEAVEERRAK
ncbi:MAG: host nuclease inhibitor protein [Zoogloeaceae bacterium]|jgi:hypothetical protein|nr:host nuclease inhibitor protein [Zoogloeaceae bacterium]